MLKYIPAKKRISFEPALSLLFIIAVSVAATYYMKNFSDSSSVLYVVFGSFISVGIVVLSGLKKDFLKKGKLEYVSDEESQASSPIDSDSITISNSYSTVFDTLEVELVGHYIEQVPLGKSVWNIISSNRSVGLITYAMRVIDPVKKGSYVRTIYLDLSINRLADNRVEINQNYRFSSPMMRKVGKRIALQTDVLLRKILFTGTIDLSSVNASVPTNETAETESTDPFEIDYLEIANKSEIIEALEQNLDSTPVHPVEHESVVQCAQEDNYAPPGELGSFVSSSQVESFEVGSPESEPSGLTNLGEISYTNFDEYADKILD